MPRKILIAALVLIAVFLVGYVPQAVRASRLSSELKAATLKNQEAHLRDLAALMYIQASQKNYGLAAQTSTAFFNSVQQTAGRVQSASEKKPFDDIFSYRDKVTAELAKGDPAVIGDLQDLYLKTRTVTGP